MFIEIDRKRRASNRTVSGLCRDAGIPVSTWWGLATGKRKAWRASTIRKLEGALALPPRAGSVVRPRHNAQMVLAAYRGHIAAIAPRFGADPAEVAASNPAWRAVRDPKWLLAAKVRSLAIYCTVVEFDIPGAVVARAIGVTKQTVSAALRRVEDLRDDPAIEAIVEAAGRLISAREA